MNGRSQPHKNCMKIIDFLQETASSIIQLIARHQIFSDSAEKSFPYLLTESWAVFACLRVFLQVLNCGIRNTFIHCKNNKKLYIFYIYPFYQVYSLCVPSNKRKYKEIISFFNHFCEHVYNFITSGKSQNFPVGEHDPDCLLNMRSKQSCQQ